MAAHSITSRPHRSTRLARWLAIAVMLVALGSAAVPPAWAGERAGTSGTVTAYVGQGWG